MFDDHLRCACRGLKASSGLTLLMVVSLGLGISVFVTSSTARLAHQRDPLPTVHDLYHVEIDRGVHMPQSDADPARAVFGRLRELTLSFDQAEQIAGLDPAQTARTFTAMLVARGPTSSENVSVRFSSSNTFAFFQHKLIEGRFYTAEEDQAGAAVVVLDESLARPWFPNESAVGKTISLAGRPYRVVGVSSHDVTRMRAQDFSWLPEPTLHLPLSGFRVLRALPMYLMAEGSGAETFDALLGPSYRFVHLWVRLPTQEARAQYEQRLRTNIALTPIAGRPDPILRLRPIDEWKALLGTPHPAYTLFERIGWVALLASCFGLMRLLVAKFQARSTEIGIRRALGASRMTIFAQLDLEALIVGALGGVFGLVLAAVGLELMSRGITNNVIQFALELPDLTIAIGAAIFTAAIAAAQPAWRMGKMTPAEALKRR